MGHYVEKIGENGEIRIPERYLKTLGVDPGDSIVVKLSRRHLLIEPAKEKDSSQLPEKVSYKALGEAIRKKRDEMGYSLRSMAEKVDMSFGYLGQLERGEVDNITLEYLLKIANGFELNILDLLDEAI